MGEHVKGPWIAHGANVFAGKNCIAVCDTDNNPMPVMEANARLMASAPDLLAACDGARQCLERIPEGVRGNHDSDINRQLRRLDAAIAKART